MLFGLQCERKWSVSYDPSLGCGIAYFRLEDPADFEAHRDLAMGELERTGHPPLATGEARPAPHEGAGYCVLFETPPYKHLKRARTATMMTEAHWRDRSDRDEEREVTAG